MYRPPQAASGGYRCCWDEEGICLFFKKNCTITADVVLFKRPVVKAGITVNLNSGRDQHVTSGSTMQ